MWKFILPVGLMVAGCGASGPAPGATYFWRLTRSALSFGACSDETEFRASTRPLTIADNSFIIYKVSGDGKTAVQQSCERLSVSSCTDAPQPLTFQVAGSELTAINEFSSQVDSGGCRLTQTQTWTLLDQGRTMSLDIANVLTLSDDPSCAQVEEDLKLRSPNRLGVVGCVVTFSLAGELE